MGERKPRVFIGSSREALPITRAIHKNLKRKAEVTPWDKGVFTPSNYPLEDLEKLLDNQDFAIFVFHTDDILIIRDLLKSAVRDNVLFEMGLFVGKLGRKRVFFIIPEVLPEELTKQDVKDFRVPSDLAGVTPLEYEVRTDGNWEAAVGTACDDIEKRIDELGCLPKDIDPTEYEYKIRELYGKIKEDRMIMGNLVRFINSLRNIKDDNDLLAAFQVSYDTLHRFAIKGTTLFCITKDQKLLEQIAKNGNVGQIGKRFPLTYNKEEQKKIHVIEAHLSGNVEIGVKKKLLEREYYICYPIAKKYVVVVHLLGNVQVDEEMAIFESIDQRNSELLGTLNAYLEGEL